MIDEYLHEAFTRERLANARRAAALYEARRECEPRRPLPWRDAIHRFFHFISFLRLKRRTERMALR